LFDRACRALDVPLHDAVVRSVWAEERGHPFVESQTHCGVFARESKSERRLACADGTNHKMDTQGRFVDVPEVLRTVDGLCGGSGSSGLRPRARGLSLSLEETER
jgi:hypothetical protein